jgi:hypothetical protein
MKNSSNNNNNNNKLNIMKKIKDVQKQLENLTNDLEILTKTYNILLIDDRKEFIKQHYKLYSLYKKKTL